MSDINKKSSPVQMREFLKLMRNPVNDINERKENNKKLEMRDLLKIMRNLNENDSLTDKKTVYDQPLEEKKFLDNFTDLNVNVKFIELEVFDNFVFWGGTVDGMIQFVYKVTPNESTSGVEFNYLNDFSPDNPENDEIIKRIEGYYNAFYKYWQNNMLQK